jgi:hypothetical protein
VVSAGTLATTMTTGESGTCEFKHSAYAAGTTTVSIVVVSN